MNVVVNPKDIVLFVQNDKVPRGFVIVEVPNGFHYISNDQSCFIPREKAEQMIKADEVRRLFGTE